MNQLDLLVLVLLVPAAIGGYQLGFVARVTSWLGLGLGLYVALRLSPRVVDAAQGSSPANRFLLVSTTLLVGGLIGQAAGLALGNAARKGLTRSPLKSGDRYAGALAGGLGLLLLVWLVLPLMADVPGWPSKLARNSLVAQQLDESLPPAPDTLQSLRNLVGDTEFPRVFDALQPAPSVGAPPGQLVLSAAVQQRVLAATAKIEVEACGQLQEGSGFVVAQNLIATNAHVVAGAEKIEIVMTDGTRRDATLVTFNPDRDLALLQVSNLRHVPLAIDNGDEGDLGAVFGHPGGQDPVRIAPARVAQRIRARGRDLYSDHETTRDVFVLASNLQRGDSGAALVDASGSVIGVAFAIAPDAAGTSYALTDDELRAELQKPRIPTRAGPCLTE